MKFLEIIVGFALIVLILAVGVNFLTGAQVKVSIYLDKLSEDSQNISLYNYSQYLTEHTLDNDSGYIYFSGDNYFTGGTGEYAYVCEKKSGNLIKINEAYNGVFCEIDFNGQSIYNYDIK